MGVLVLFKLVEFLIRVFRWSGADRSLIGVDVGRRELEIVKVICLRSFVEKGSREMGY